MRRKLHWTMVAVASFAFVAGEQRALATGYVNYVTCLWGCQALKNPIKRAICVAGCNVAYLQKFPPPTTAGVSGNIEVTGSNIGFNAKAGIPNIYILDPDSLVIVNLTYSGVDTPDSVDVYLLDEDNNPGSPGPGTLVGTDNNGGDGWNVGFTPSAVTSSRFFGHLHVVANVPGHDLDLDPDATAIPIGSVPIVPAVSEWGLVVMALLLGSAATIALVRRAGVPQHAG